jgi:hypothetical protein
MTAHSPILPSLPLVEFIDQLRRLQTAQEAIRGIDFADLTNPGNRYERLHLEAAAIRKEAEKVADAIGINLWLIAEAFQ